MVLAETPNLDLIFPPEVIHVRVVPKWYDDASLLNLISFIDWNMIWVLLDLLLLILFYLFFFGQFSPRPLPEDAHNQEDELETAIANGNRPGKHRDLWERLLCTTGNCWGHTCPHLKDDSVSGLLLIEAFTSSDKHVFIRQCDACNEMKFINYLRRTLRFVVLFENIYTLYFMADACPTKLIII